VGMLLQAHEGYDELWVTKLVPGHPAALCGQIMVQDVLCAVDGTPVLGWDLDAVCDIIKGEEGTPVVLEFRRGALDSYKITLHRGGDQLWKLPAEHVMMQLPKGTTPRDVHQNTRPRAMSEEPGKFREQSSSAPTRAPEVNAPEFDYGFSIMRH